MTIEGNDGRSNETNELLEYFDGVRNIAVTKIITSKIERDIYTNSKLNEAYVVIGT
jgi:hypothetical protein